MADNHPTIIHQRWPTSRSHHPLNRSHRRKNKGFLDIIEKIILYRYVNRELINKSKPLLSLRNNTAELNYSILYLIVISVCVHGRNYVNLVKISSWHRHNKMNRRFRNQLCQRNKSTNSSRCMKVHHRLTQVATTIATTKWARRQQIR